MIEADSQNPVYSSINGVLYNKSKTELLLYPYGRASLIFAVPDGVTKIGNNAFAQNKTLIEISLPESLKTIGGFSFAGCKALEYIDIPASVTEIGGKSFAACPALTEVNFFGASTKIGACAFSNCSQLAVVRFPSAATTIDMYAFEECYSLKSISLPNTVTTLGEGAFKNCINLTTANIPTGVKEIQRFTFWGCKNLNSITIPSGVTEIGNVAFGGTALSSVIIPASVQKLGMSVFEECGGLKQARFYGNLPGLIFDEYAYSKEPWFQGAASAFTIYYLEGKQGWTTPLWNGYKTQSFAAVTLMPQISSPIRVSLQPLPKTVIDLDALIKSELTTFPIIPIISDPEDETALPETVPSIEPSDDSSPEDSGNQGSIKMNFSEYSGLKSITCPANGNQHSVLKEITIPGVGNHSINSYNGDMHQKM